MLDDIASLNESENKLTKAEHTSKMTTVARRKYPDDDTMLTAFALYSRLSNQSPPDSS